MCLRALEDFNHNTKSLKVVLWTGKHLSCWKHESNRFSQLKLTWIWDTSYWQSNNCFDRLEFLYFSEILSLRSMYRVKMIVKTELFHVELIFWLFLLILLGIHSRLIISCLFITFGEKQIKAAIHLFFSFMKMVWNSSIIQQQSAKQSVVVNGIKEKIHVLASLLTLFNQDKKLPKEAVRSGFCGDVKRREGIADCKTDIKCQQ